MSCCGQCRGLERQFGERTAARDLRRYRRRGPLRSTRLLIEALRAQEIQGGTLLDVGGGIGAIQHELLRSGLRRAVHVDASSHYLAASREEARRQGHEQQVEYVHGDFVDRADGLPDAEIVTLDRVICCYPDMERLVEAAATRTRRLLGVVYPRDRLGTRLGLPLVNLLSWMRRSPFRVFLHPPATIVAAIRLQGLEPCFRGETPLWRVEVYRRAAQRPL